MFTPAQAQMMRVPRRGGLQFEEGDAERQGSRQRAVAAISATGVARGTFQNDQRRRTAYGRCHAIYCMIDGRCLLMMFSFQLGYSPNRSFNMARQFRAVLALHFGPF